MNDIANNFLLAGDRLMPEMHLRKSGFTFSTCGPFTKNKEQIQKFMQTGDANYIYKNDLDKACFLHDLDKVIRDKAFEIASNPKYDGYQRGLASMSFKFFDKKSKGSGITSMPNQQVANELHKPIIRKFKKKEKYIMLLRTIFRVLV